MVLFLNLKKNNQAIIFNASLFIYIYVMLLLQVGFGCGCLTLVSAIFPLYRESQYISTQKYTSQNNERICPYDMDAHNHKRHNRQK
jgi:hypothetical protein